MYNIHIFKSKSNKSFCCDINFFVQVFVYDVFSSKSLYSQLQSIVQFDLFKDTLLSVNSSHFMYSNILLLYLLFYLLEKTSVTVS